MGTEILYSASYPQEPTQRASSHGAPMTIEVIKLTQVPRGMTNDDWKKLAGYTTKSIDVAKSIIETGKSFLTSDEKKPLKMKLECIMAVGDILKGIAKFAPEPDNKTVIELEKLDNQLKIITQNMSTRFEEMKSFITEVNFFVKIISPTNTLIRFMRDCLTHPGPEAVENFRYVYERHPPVELAYALRSFLERRNTNPLLMDMDREVIKTNGTFNKWAGLFESAFAQFLFLEAFASGFLGIQNDNTCDRLIEKAVLVMDDLKDWRKGYTDKNYGYWNDIKKDLESMLKDKKYKNNKERADAIKERMDNYMTNDSFYIIVYDSKNSNQENRLWSRNCIGNDQLINRENCNGVNAFVYCSKKGKTMPWDELDDMRKKVQAFKTEQWLKGKLLEELKKNPIKGAGFMCIIGGLNEEVRAANFTRHDDGPGWYTYYYPWGGAENQRLLAGCE
ncbi:unnamed protein product [Caenorhabditis brenneri]